MLPSVACCDEEVWPEKSFFLKLDVLFVLIDPFMPDMPDMDEFAIDWLPTLLPTSLSVNWPVLLMFSMTTSLSSYSNAWTENLWDDLPWEFVSKWLILPLSFADDAKLWVYTDWKN